MPEELRLVPRPSRVASPTMRDLLSIVFRQRRLVLLVFGMVFLALLLYGLLAPSYKAHMKILLRHSRVDPMMAATPTPTSEFARAEIPEEELNSEVELLQDEDILRAVVKNAGLAGESWLSKLRRENEEVRVSRAARQLARDLTVAPVRKTNVISVSYSSSDPAKSARVLRRLADAYLEKHLEVRRPSGQFSFFEQQVTEARKGLEDAELQLMQFTRGQGVVSASLERDIALQKLSEAEAADRQTRVAIAETVERVRTLQTKLQSLPERTTTQIRNTDNPDLLGKMKSRLLELQLKRTELLTKYEPSYRLVQEVDQQLEETKAAIAKEDREPLRDQVTEKDPNHEWAKSEMVKAQVELSTLTARSVASRPLLASYHEAARNLGDRAIQQDELVRNLKTAEEKYLLYVNKREEARIGDALDQKGILNVAFAEYPAVPAQPVHSAWMYGFAGILLAGVCSTGSAFAADYLNPAFRTPDEVIRYLGEPVLASLPRGDA